MTFKPQFRASNIEYEVSQRDRRHRLRRHRRHSRAGAAIWAWPTPSTSASTCSRSICPITNPTMCSTSPTIALCNGTCLQDIELRRNDENYPQRSRHATAFPIRPRLATSAVASRRTDLYTFIDIINETRLKVWAKQPDDFFDCATIDMDGTDIETTGECKEGMDISYDGIWGYHPLALTLAEHRRSAERRQSLRQSAVARRRRRGGGSSSCRCASKPASARSFFAATPISRKRVISMVGTATRGFASSSATTPRQI